MNKSKRIAFVTDEYPTTLPNAGGLASYVQRMAHLLCDMGNSVEIFVRSGRRDTYVDGSVIVHEVPPLGRGYARLETLLGKSWRLNKRYQAAKVFRELDRSAGLAKAVEVRETEQEFDLIQSSDYQFRGLFIRRRNRPHIIRCSWARDLFQRVEGTEDRPPNRLFAWLERLSIRRATSAYAPSEFVSRYYRNEFGLNVGVVRPPLFVLNQRPEEVEVDIPLRYLLHIGNLCRRKGSDLVAASLPLAWEAEPDLKMIWAGKALQDLFPGFQRDWGERARNVQWLGAVPRGQVATLLRRAAGSVLPSRCDNLPNTVIESLLAGIPVIGTLNSSIDELVTHEENGLLVPCDDPKQLAAAMIRVWRGQFRWKDRGPASSAVFVEMQPEVAAQRLLSFAR